MCLKYCWMSGKQCNLNQMHSMASDLGLYCLHNPVCPNILSLLRVALIFARTQIISNLIPVCKRCQPFKEHLLPFLLIENTCDLQGKNMVPLGVKERLSAPFMSIPVLERKTCLQKLSPFKEWCQNIQVYPTLSECYT